LDFYPLLCYSVSVCPGSTSFRVGKVQVLFSLIATASCLAIIKREFEQTLCLRVMKISMVLACCNISKCIQHRSRGTSFVFLHCYSFLLSLRGEFMQTLCLRVMVLNLVWSLPAAVCWNTSNTIIFHVHIGNHIAMDSSEWYPGPESVDIFPRWRCCQSPWLLCYRQCDFPVSRHGITDFLFHSFLLSPYLLLEIEVCMFGRHFSFVSEIHTVVGRLISCECAGLKLMLLSAF
jgi:hypothetical protein